MIENFFAFVIFSFRSTMSVPWDIDALGWKLTPDGWVHPVRGIKKSLYCDYARFCSQKKKRSKPFCRPTSRTKKALPRVDTTLKLLWKAKVFLGRPKRNQSREICHSCTARIDKIGARHRVYP